VIVACSQRRRSPGSHQSSRGAKRRSQKGLAATEGFRANCEQHPRSTCKQMKKFYLSLITTLNFLFAVSYISGQIAPAGLTVIQNPLGVYYVLYSDSIRPNRARFYYLNYLTSDFDVITPSVSASGAFSGSSSNTGRFVGGNIGNQSISLSFNGVSVSGTKESIYGPTSRFAGQWIGTVFDPFIGVGFGELYVSSNNQCLVFYLQDFAVDVGIGTISANGFTSVPLLSGVTISGTFAPANGGAEGTFSYSTGGQNSYALTKAVTPRLANISTRGLVGSGQQVLIAGFIMTDGGKTVLIDAKGPSLAAYGVTGTIKNPRLDLYFGSKIIASNADWKSNTNASEIAASGIAPTDDREPALQVNLEPGAYTVVVSSEDATSGIGLVEVYGVGSAVGN
jgi:hypothetical protein